MSVSINVSGEPNSPKRPTDCPENDEFLNNILEERNINEKYFIHLETSLGVA